ncbi:hypothetical protein B0H14DRAFT_2889203 [Mycena olivaceomarginata]|nr:hypothetical protein B0H14DRAFT_2889203 [Mycena olivaceomarginata]
MEWTLQAPYLNARERNVHVWASQLSRSNRPCLVAGCWTDGVITVQTFYQWLAQIVVPAPQGATYVLVAAGNHTIMTAAGLFVMGPAAFNAHVNACRSRPHEQFNSTANLLAGDYLLFQVTHQSFQPAIPVLKTATITSRTTTRGQTGTHTPRDARSRVTRRAVRERDFRCRVTGVMVPVRQRGPNFKGMQVAHIFPLGWMSKAPSMLSSATRNSMGNGDKPVNAILMKADVHDQFDDYQFGFWPDGQNVFRFYRFENSGAPSIGPGATAVPMFPRLGAPATPEPIDELLRAHFITALLWHVAGFGRRQGL